MRGINQRYRGIYHKKKGYGGGGRGASASGWWMGGKEGAARKGGINSSEMEHRHFTREVPGSHHESGSENLLRPFEIGECRGGGGGGGGGGGVSVTKPRRSRIRQKRLRTQLQKGFDGA